MKALWKSENGLLTKVEIEEPTVIESDDVKVKVQYASIGTEDMRMYREGDVFSRANIAGYEMSGIITEAGEQAARNGYEVGQRVAGTTILFCGKCDFCRKNREYCCEDFQIRAGTICEYLVWKDRQLVRLKDSITDKMGALVEPVAVVVEAADRLNVSIGSSVCIFGADFQGLVLLQLMRMHGTGEITVVAPDSRGREMALKLGADHVVDLGHEDFENDLLKITGFKGYDAIAITEGELRVAQKALSLAARGGVVLLMTHYELGQKVSVESTNLYYAHITLAGSSLYSRNKLELAVDLIPKLQLAELVSAEYSFEDSIDAFTALESGLHPRIAIKI